MTSLVWDTVGERFYETGCDHGVLYRINPSGVYDTGFAWNGLVSVTESPTGAESTKTYADNIPYLNLISLEEFEATIEAYTYPDEFAECDGSAQPESGVLIGQQPRKLFGLSYRTRVGNDLEGTELGYKLHLVWNAFAAPSEKGFNTINDSPEAITFSWDLTTTPVSMTGYKPTASMTIDSTKVDSTALATLEAMIYGGVGVDPLLPTPDDVLAVFAGSVTETAMPTPPAYNSTTDIVTIPTITGVVYYTDADGTLPSGAYGPITENVLIKVRPATGYKFPAGSDDDFLIVFV
jgi:hypothetical protein